MITSTIGYQQTLEQIKNLQATLAGYKQQYNNGEITRQWFDLLCEGSAEDIQQMQAEVKIYQAHLRLTKVAVQNPATRQKYRRRV